MINKIKDIVKKTSIKTKVELIIVHSFEDFIKITIIDGKKFTFVLNTEEFIDFYAQMEIIQKQRINFLVDKFKEVET